MADAPVPSSTTTGKTRIAVLGCGMSSVAAMYSLTQRPEDRAKYEITAYQTGWRIGGKGASGRNMDMGARIEEHGLHIWFGFYENAFRIMRDAYQALGRKPGTPLWDLDHAFTPHDYIVLMDEYDGDWRTPWQYTFPTNDETPGTGQDLPSMWNLMSYGLTGLADMLKANLFDPHERCSGHGLLEEHAHEHWFGRLKDFVDDVEEAVEDLVDMGAIAGLGYVVRTLDKLDKVGTGLPDELARTAEWWLVEALEACRRHMWKAYGCHVGKDLARECLVLGDAVITSFVGMLKDDVRRKGIFSIDDVELTKWLEGHGANPLTISSPIVRALYDNIFAYVGGDKSNPNAGAGTSLLWCMRMVLTYKGHIMYKMNAGMGDTVFTPFYQVLKDRGVKFEFFHCVTNLGLDADKSAVDTIDVMRQVDLTVDEYQPLVSVKDLDCWPNQPNWDQIVDGDQLKARGVNLEQVVTPYAGRTPTTLKRGADFDVVILGMPIATLKDVTPELYANAAKPAWKAMLDNVQTVQTQAYQLWMNKSLGELGWIHGTDSPVVGTYVEPIDTYADMSHLIPMEDQPASENVRSIAYFCGVMKDCPTQADANSSAGQACLDNLESAMPRLWAKLNGPSGGVDWSVLVDPNRAGVGAERFAAQFVRANWTSTERYTLSLAGSTKYRLKADQSGYANLFLAGDWTSNYFNSGCIEGSTMSGMQASRAICGYPQRIVGEPPDVWEGDA